MLQTVYVPDGIWRRCRGLLAWGPNELGGAETRVLVAIEDGYRAYRGVLAAGIEALRPSVEVATAPLCALDEEISRFDPQVIVCSRPCAADPGDGRAWVELSLDPTRPSKVRRDGGCLELENPTLESLLKVVDEVERHARAS